MNDVRGADRDRKWTWIRGVGLVAVLGGVIYAGFRIAPYFSSATEFREMVQNAGALGPVLFVLLQAVQVLVAPIPGQVSGLAGGYLFGAALGTVLTMMGLMIGSAFAMVLARKLGRPLVERFVAPRLLDKWDAFLGKRGVPAFFLVYLLPALPDDAVCFIAGLTRLPLAALLAACFLGRLPGMLLLSLAGAGLEAGDEPVVWGIIAVVVIGSGLLFWQRERIERWVGARRE